MTAPAMFPGKTLTVRYAARYSGLSNDKIRELVTTRQVATLDRGKNGRGRIHILTASLDAWLDAQTVEPIVAPINESKPATFDADDDIPVVGQPLFS